MREPVLRSVAAPSAAADFTHLAAILLVSTDLIDARHKSEGHYLRPCPSRVADILKAAVSAGDLADANWAGNLAPYRQISEGFLSSLASASVFDRVLQDAMKIPLARGRIVAATSIATGSSVAPGATKPITKLVLSAPVVDPVKAVALLVVSDELAKSALEGSMQFLSNELRNGVAAATDTKFLTDLLASVTPIPSSGDLAEDLRVLLNVIDLHASSRLILAINSAAMKGAAVQNTDGPLDYPTLTVNGGTVAGIAVVPTDQIANGAAILIDATAIAAATGPVVLASAEHASLKMDSAPAAGPGNLTHLWQANSKAVRAERFFAWEVLRTGAIAALSGANYGGGSGS